MVVGGALGMNFIETLENWSATPARTLATPVQNTNLFILGISDAKAKSYGTKCFVSSECA